MSASRTSGIRVAAIVVAIAVGGASTAACSEDPRPVAFPTSSAGGVGGSTGGVGGGFGRDGCAFYCFVGEHCENGACVPDTMTESCVGSPCGAACRTLGASAAQACTISGACEDAVFAVCTCTSCSTCSTHGCSADGGDDGGSVVDASDCLLSPEVCNGLDDNCSGTIDEGDPEGGGDCTRGGLQGICGTGVRHCVSGVVTCVGRLPEAESCNGLDDDCNEQVDDGISCVDAGLDGGAD